MTPETRLSKFWPGKVEIVESLEQIDFGNSNICGYLPPVGRNLDIIKKAPLLYKNANWLRRSWDNDAWPHATKGFSLFTEKL